MALVVVAVGVRVTGARVERLALVEAAGVLVGEAVATHLSALTMQLLGTKKKTWTPATKEMTTTERLTSRTSKT